MYSGLSNGVGAHMSVNLCSFHCHTFTLNTPPILCIHRFASQTFSKTKWMVTISHRSDVFSSKDRKNWFLQNCRTNRIEYIEKSMQEIRYLPVYTSQLRTDVFFTDNILKKSMCTWQYDSRNYVSGFFSSIFHNYTIAIDSIIERQIEKECV